MDCRPNLTASVLGGGIFQLVVFQPLALHDAWGSARFLIEKTECSE
jgi:hypothetical protein